jgi:DNA-binding winged helix-turn-helix (wHTH) protein/Tol biopolymer transport system component
MLAVEMLLSHTAPTAFSVRKNMESKPDYAARVVSFGAFEVDLRVGELRRNGVKVKVQNQPFQILAMLLDRPGDLITREEMRARLWPADTFVDFDHGLNSAMRRLRDALGDFAENPTYIETLERRGYRFIFPVESQSGDHGRSGLAIVIPISPAEPAPAPSYIAGLQGRKLKVASVIAFGIGLIAVAVLIVHSSSARIAQLGRRIVTIPGETRPFAATQKQLTANPQDTPVTSSAISPDGKYLAYTDRTGFYLRQIATGETHAISLPNGVEPFIQGWFPDSVHLLYSWAEVPNKRPSLWSISIMGGSPRRIADEGAAAGLSPDASKIAFLRFSGDRNEIWLMAADGTDAHRVVAPVSSGIETFSPVAWAPESKHFAYIRTIIPVYNAADSTGLKKTIEIADAESGHSEVVLSNSDLENALAWTKNDLLIYALREGAGNQSDFGLWSMPLASGTARPLQSGTKLASGRGWAASLSVASDGRSMALRQTQPAADVYIAEVGAGAERLSPKRLTLDDRGDFAFAWTPDSKAVLFLSDRTGPLHLFKQDINQTQSELLVGGDDVLAIPRLDPTGNYLLYLVMPKRGQASDSVKIRRMPLNGGPSQVVMQAPGIWNHQCARMPAMLCIYTPNEPNQQRFFAFDPVTGASKELPLAKVSTDPEKPNWNLSPDGNYLATTIARSERDAAVRILSLVDGSYTVLALPGWPRLGGLDWAADGKSLWVAASNSRSGGPETCALLNVARNGKIRVMTDYGTVCYVAGIPSPDGRYLALEGERADSSNVWLLEDF